MRMLLAALAVGASSIAATAQAPQAPAAAPPAHVTLTPGDIKWGPAPPTIPPGPMVAVMAGDPGGTGPFTIRIKFPDGFRMPAHWHPTDEHVTVLSGTLALGMGDTIEPAAMTKVAAGGYALLPAGMHHSARAASAVTVQVEGLGPFALTYVNPADDPTQRVTRKQVEKGHPAR